MSPYSGNNWLHRVIPENAFRTPVSKLNIFHLQASQHCKGANWYFTKRVDCLCVRALCSQHITLAVTKDCGILSLLEPGDEVMAGRGFEIEGDLPPGASLNIPLFFKDQPQLSEHDDVAARRIAKDRIHVERIIQRVKSYRILPHTLSISESADLNKMLIIFSYLTLFNKPCINCITLSKHMHRLGLNILVAFVINCQFSNSNKC